MSASLPSTSAGSSRSQCSDWCDPGEDRAGLAGVVTDGDDVVEGLAEELLDGLARRRRPVDPRIGEDPEREGMHALRLGAGRVDLEVVASETTRARPRRSGCGRCCRCTRTGPGWGSWAGGPLGASRGGLDDRQAPGRRELPGRDRDRPDRDEVAGDLRGTGPAPRAGSSTRSTSRVARRRSSPPSRSTLRWWLTVGWATSQHDVKSQAHTSPSLLSWRRIASRVGSAAAWRRITSGSVARFTSPTISITMSIDKYRCIA